MRHHDRLSNQDRGAEVRPADRAFARAPRALRPELFARQGSADLLRREHARRRAARARRRHSAPRAGRHLRPRHRRPQHHRGAAARAARAGRDGAVHGDRPARFRPVPLVVRRARRRSVRRRRSRCKASASRRPIRGSCASICASNGVEAQVVAFSGAVEIAPSLGKADLICDLVSSGSTLRAHQLYEAETILESRAALIQTPKRLRAPKPSGCSGCCREFRECCRSRRASTSCCTRRVRP